MKKTLLAVLALACAAMGSCSADDEAIDLTHATEQLDGGPGSGNGGITPPPPPPPPPKDTGL